MSLEEEEAISECLSDSSPCPISSLLFYLRELPFHQDKDTTSKRIESLDEDVSWCPCSDEQHIGLIVAKGRMSCLLGTGGLALETESPSTLEGTIRFHYK